MWITWLLSGIFLFFLKLNEFFLKKTNLSINTYKHQLIIKCEVWIKMWTSLLWISDYSSRTVYGDYRSQIKILFDPDSSSYISSSSISTGKNLMNQKKLWKRVSLEDLPSRFGVDRFYVENSWESTYYTEYMSSKVDMELWVWWGWGQERRFFQKPSFIKRN